MKRLIDYFNKVDRESKPLKIMAPQNSTKEELWNSPDDRWSRKAKHPMTVNEAEVIDDVKWKKGDKGLYENQEVEIKIPNGAKDTVGILFEGTVKMVHKNEVKEIEKLEENVMGGIQAINPITRMLQLSGISPIAEEEKEKKNCVKCEKEFTPSYGEHHRCPECLGKEHTEAEHARKVQETESNVSETGVMGSMQAIRPINRMMQLAGLEEVSSEVPPTKVIEEDEASFFDQLVNNQLNGEFKNNPNAARLAAIGETLIGLQDLVDDVEQAGGQLSNDTTTRLNTLKAMGASFINDARSLLKLNG